MAKKLRPSGTGSSDTTATPSGSGPHIFQDTGDGYITVYTPQGVEGSDTIYVAHRREPKAVGVTYTASVLGSGG
jgi:hypothetical protein